ncbi:MBL fold metallo-hydrolase [Sphingomonas sp. CBMAI 2297]|uniref:ComEC/Rec2 family competence protein n=1 Tax=Sphingomonas sp. CBMAI 2297 TaxID=2991720 RepID=UPI0024567625|nr:MBL fold metallo-hydrolase [Sphingomonas sp. CBMAI 2297]MDH4743813.1 MBL fold metallo-hydrolase [Sphingomonas sp. CBMAI 2297]
MPDFFEIDFLDVETRKSGDAIALRYEIAGERAIHVVDGGFDAMSERIIAHIVTHYDNKPIDHVVVTHPDGDHACGLRGVIERCNVGTLWMLRPWIYAEALLPYFTTYNSAERLASRLRALYPYIADLERIAIERDIPIAEPFQGARIGAFTVLAPSPQRYIDCLLTSDKTPEVGDERDAIAALFEEIAQFGKAVVNFARGAWGYEVFSTGETSAENEMSVVQAAIIGGQRIVLTGDAGRQALAEAADFAPTAGINLPGVHRFQVPHHGSRRNVSTELLDRWLGPRLDRQLPEGYEVFTAVCSSAKADPDHPRKSVERAFLHRGARFITTEDGDVRTQWNAPERLGWGPLPHRPYPEAYEE